MEQLLKQIEDIKKEITASEAANAAALEEFRIKYLGTKGLVKQIMGEMKNVPNDQKKEFGQILNAFKIVAEEKFEALQAGLGAVTYTHLTLPTNRKVYISCSGAIYKKKQQERRWIL